MSERQKIEERLRRKEAEISGLEEKIKAAKVYVQALRDILKMIGTSASDGGAIGPAETGPRAGSAVARSRDIILEHGAPVHISELLQALGREPTRESRASLTSSLSAYVRRGEIFTRPAPNTFGLLELGHSEETDRQATPPKGFGTDEIPQDTGNDEVGF